MADLSNISILDHEEISDFIFINRDNWNSPQESSEDHLIEIDNNASINARFYFKNPDSTNAFVSGLPAILSIRTHTKQRSDQPSIMAF